MAEDELRAEVAGARVGARSTLFPGARIGRGAEIAAGSTVRGAVPAGQHWAGSPAGKAGKSGLNWPASRPPRSRFWIAAYGATSALLGLLPARLAALEARTHVELGPGWHPLRSKRYGDTVVTLARRAAGAQAGHEEEG